MQSKRKVISEINVVPYIDVMLVLLIIFMVTAPLLTQGIKVELPKAGAEPIADSSSLTPLILSVDAQGNLFINVGDDEDKPQDSKSIISRTRALLNSQPTTMVLVKADRSVPYGNVVGAMVLLQQGGAKDIGFVTDPLETYPVPE
ncbi:MAG: protein TolR [Pseudomonadota bacterium]|nr:protein TolR [Pseudomonadota bacterium]MEC8955655.1 protein TolR [Pseudomonadota bacterium]